MEEKIGNITLDYTYYPGRDLYSDGPVEEELLRIAKSCREEELNRVIREKNSWPVLYHFSHIRQNILEWLPITKRDRVLEIGSGCGAVTGALARKAGQVTCIDLSKMRSTINAYRNRDRDNIRILVGNFRDIEQHLPETYDYITLIGVFEYSQGYIGTEKPYEEMIRRISSHLSPGGKIVIAIENRLGMKYWAGCAEDHTGLYFDGIQGYPSPSGVRTFSRGELAKILERAGNFRTAFYYPCPDYKFPMVLYSDSYLPKKGDFKGNVLNFDRPRMALFDEAKALDSMADTGMFREFSNSFLVVAEAAEKMPVPEAFPPEKDAEDRPRKEEAGQIIFSKYSNERAKAFSIRTDILERDGQRYVKKTALHPEGREHILSLLKWQELLNKEYESAPFLCNVCTGEEDGVRLEYLEGRTLEEALDELIGKGEREDASRRLLAYLRQIRAIHDQQPFTVTDEFRNVFGDAALSGEQTCAPVTNIDLVCSNLILNEVPQVLDYEWTFDFPVPCKYVLYRVIHYYLETSALRGCLDEEEFYGPMGISLSEREVFARMERHFQNYITRGHCAVRDMYASISPGVLEMKKEMTPCLQVFFNRGAGYREEDSQSFPFRDGSVSVKVKLPPDCLSLRLDPGDLPCGAEIGRLSFDKEPVNLKKAVIQEGCVRGNWVYIAREDPSISEIPVPHGAKALLVSMKLHPADRELAEQLMGLEKIRQDLTKNLKQDVKQEWNKAKEWVKDPEGGKGREYLRTLVTKSAGVRSSLRRLRGEQPPAPGSYAYYERTHRPSPEELKRQREEHFSPAPFFSVVTPLYNTPVKYLKAFLDSVAAQSYENWELCLADGSEKDTIEKYIRKNYGKEKRIRYLRLKKNRGISGNTNAAIGMARGTHLVFADHDDMLTEDALYQAAKTLREHPETELLYSDEDLADAAGTPLAPHFKPDYNPDLLLSMNYICHLLVVRKELQEKAGFMRKEFDGSQDYDFLLRCVEQTGQIRHIPRVLYHWRVHGGSTAGSSENKHYAVQAGLRALQEHYERTSVAARVTYTGVTVVYRTTYEIAGNPLISILIPNKDHGEDLKRCIGSVLEKSSWQNFELLILENNSEKEETFRLYEELQKQDSRVRVLRYPGEFNYSAVNNFGASRAAGDYLLLLNNDTEVIAPDWMERMLGYCQREGTAVAGAKLLYPDDKVQHAGIVIGMGGFAGHVLTGSDREEPGYLRRLITAMDVSAVTGACMMIKRSIYEKLGGLDENYAVALNDVDFCLRAGELGQKVVFVPEALLYHYESRTRGPEDTLQKAGRFQGEIRRFQQRHAELLKSGDPCYNPNLSLTRTDYSWRD